MLKRMLNYLSLLSVLIAFGCKEEQRVELCLGSVDGSRLACNDERREESQYFRSLQKGDICTNPRDYEATRRWCLDNYKKLKACQRRN